MSAFLYPSILGLSFNYVRSYEWNTAYQQAVSGKRSALSLRFYPLVRFELEYELLRDDTATSDLKSIMGLFNSVKGRGDSFLFSDPDFNIITPAQASQYGVFGTGDGSTLGFQLVASYQNSGGPGAVEIIQNLNGTPVLYDNGAPISSSNYSISSVGFVTFGAGHAPAAGHQLTWSGGFYYRCDFTDDTFDFVKFMNQWWNAQKIKFSSIIL